MNDDYGSIIESTKEKWEYVEMFDIVRLRYKVSDQGRVYDMKRGIYLQPSPHHRTGFMTVNLRKRTGAYKPFLMHRLVFEVFKKTEFESAQSKKWQILHKDGNIRNNNLINLLPAPKHVVRKQRTQEISKIVDPELILVTRAYDKDISE